MPKSATSAEVVRIYTDGACKGNPGPGGWGALLKVGADEKELFGGELNTTNNRMELTAVIRALESLNPPPCDVAVYTDSQYVQKGISEWLHDWKRRGWRTADKKPVKNLDLWRELTASFGGEVNTESLMRADLWTYLSDNCLAKTDRASMLCSLESRRPTHRFTRGRASR